MFHVYWPATACLTMFVLGIIIVLLRYGPRICKTRHTVTDEADWEDKTYEQRVSYA